MKRFVARAWPGLLIVLLGIGVLGSHAQRYAGFISDDALISLRYADRLIEGRGLQWNDGERVEGYSNLAWVLATAALGALGMNLVVAARALGHAGLVTAMVALVWLHARRSAASLLPSIFGVVALGLCGSFAIWAQGGLEQPMLTALLAWALVLLASRADQAAQGGFPADRRVALAGLLLGVACWTRPDAPLFVASTAAAVLVVGGWNASTRRAGVLVAAPGVVFVLLQLAFRLAYYGDWLPNPARSKLAMSSVRLIDGLAYFTGGMKALAGLWLPALALFFLALRRPALRATALLFGLPLVVWSGWVIFIGGDIFPGRRHLVVVVMLLALLAAEFLRSMLEGASRSAQAGVILAATACLVLLGVDQWSGDRAHLRARQEIVWARQGESLGRTLGQAFALEQPLLAVTAAGALPFYSGLPALDMLGLNDRYLALHPPADLGTGRIAHELGDGQYVLSREPDLVIFCGTSGVERACSRGGREMQADDRFAREYELVTLLGDFGLPVHGKVFVRTRSPRIGTSTTEQGAILIPGLLLNDRPGSLAGLDASGRLGALLFAGQPVSFAPLSLAPGHYRVDVEGSGHVALHARAIPAPGGVDLARGTAPLHFVVDPPGVEVELMLETDADEAHVRRIRIEREPDLPAPPQPSRGGS